MCYIRCIILPDERMVLTHQVHDDLTVRVRLEVILPLKRLSQCDVVVDLTVDSEDNLAVFADERLGTGVYWRANVSCMFSSYLTIWIHVIMPTHQHRQWPIARARAQCLHRHNNPTNQDHGVAEAWRERLLWVGIGRDRLGGCSSRRYRT